MLLGLYSLFFSYYSIARVYAIAHSVIITEHKVPRAVLNGTEHVVLDCVYTVKPDATRGLVVTWYFNNNPSPVYQWIWGQPPRTIGPLKSRIRLGYEATADDDLAKYRALYISRPTTELTGHYKCVVSTYSDEDFMIKEMTVYAPGKYMHMKRTKTGSDTVNISCTISRVFPLPRMQLYKLDLNGTTGIKNSTLDIEILDYKYDGAYDVTVSTLFSESELPSCTIFFCQVIIPGTPYNVTKRFIYNSGNSESLFGADNFAQSSKICSSQLLQWTITLIVRLLVAAVPN